VATIANIWLKIKNRAGDLLADWGLVAIVFLVGLSSFGLGRLSVLETVKEPISIRQAPEGEARGMHVGGLVVASRSGSAYHYPWCPGAETIAPHNRIWFESEAKARAAGYSPARNCKGLE